MQRNITVMEDLQGYFSNKQLELIISNAPTEELKLLYRILLTTGRRITEVIGRKEYINRNKGNEKFYHEVKGLTPSAIDKEKRLVKFNILKKKYKTQKLFPIENNIYNDLINYIEKNNIQPEQPIFKLSRFKVYYELNKECEKLGIYAIGKKGPHPHNFRHTFAINVLSNSNSPTAIKQLKDLLAHSNIDITSTYLQFNQEETRELLNKTFGDQNGN